MGRLMTQRLPHTEHRQPDQCSGHYGVSKHTLEQSASLMRILTNKRSAHERPAATDSHMDPLTRSCPRSQHPPQYRPHHPSPQPWVQS